MTRKLDRIEALMTTLKPPYRFSDQMWHQISHDVLALVEIAKAARKIANYDFEYADEYALEMRDIARTALARLEDNQ